MVDSGLLYEDFSTAQDILDRRKYLLRCNTGSTKFDSFLKGGIESQAIRDSWGIWQQQEPDLLYIMCYYG